ncbi:FMN-dependent NADH-azoreductase [Achromobacter spanius]|uniref:FMN-dependent NADH-azoreductase n=1 Tax=Achromobacter spanius TaxID=217203 RepID=UPI003F692656
MNILHITCSPRGRASESHRLSQRIIERLVDDADGAAPAIVELDATCLPHVDHDYALALSAPADPPDDVLNRGALRLSTELIQALQDATHIVIATPMHNFTVPSALKVWIDHVVRVRSTFRITPEGKIGNLPDRPVYVAVSSGGEFSGDAARQPDFLTPYLKHVLGTIGLSNVTFFSVQGTARGDAALQAARALADAEIAAHPLATASVA